MAHRSNQADIGYLLFNVFVFSVVFGWAILSYQFISNGIIAGLVALAGPVTPSTSRITRSIITVMLFLAYELGYWFNHWLSHKVPLLWEFHKVHHTAEVLTPLTNFRVIRSTPGSSPTSSRSRPRSPAVSAITCSATPPINMP